MTAELFPTEGRGQGVINLLPQRFPGCELIHPLGPGQGHSEVATAQRCFAETTHLYPVQTTRVQGLLEADCRLWTRELQKPLPLPEPASSSAALLREHR